jgi:Family of unknown function (DUF6226)
MNRWGSDRPPPEAYSRVTNPERFRPLHDFALTLLAQLHASFDVDRIEGHGLDSELEVGAVARPSVRLVPRDSKAAPVTVTFTTFPGLRVRAGRWCTDVFPGCGCDACDETANDETIRLAEMIDAVAAGRFREGIAMPPEGEVWQEWERWSPPRRFSGRLLPRQQLASAAQSSKGTVNCVLTSRERDVATAAPASFPRQRRGVSAHEVAAESVWSSRALSDRLDLRPNSPNNGASTAAVCATVIATRTHNCASVRSAVVTRCDRYRCCWFEPVARRLLEERRCCDRTSGTAAGSSFITSNTRSVDWAPSCTPTLAFSSVRNTGALQPCAVRQLTTPLPYSPPTTNAAFLRPGITATHRARSQIAAGIPLSGVERSSPITRAASASRCASPLAGAAAAVVEAASNTVMTMSPFRIIASFTTLSCVHPITIRLLGHEARINCCSSLAMEQSVRRKGTRLSLALELQPASINLRIDFDAGHGAL